MSWIAGFLPRERLTWNHKLLYFSSYIQFMMMSPSRKTVYLLYLLLLCCVMPESIFGQRADSSYVFSYFKGNGEDGLHLAWSADGLKWKALKNDSSFLKPELSADKLMRDPCIIRGADGLFHMVWTVSWNEKGLGYANSPDLLNWSEQQFLPVMAGEPGTRNTWAPELTYDPATGDYMIYWASTITGKYPETASAKENGYNHRMYYTLTKDFKTYTPTELLYNPGFNVIDASIVKYKENFVMFLKDETIEPAQKNIKIAYSNALNGPYSPAGPAITGDFWAEGPAPVYLNGEWLVYFDRYTDHRYGAVRSADLQQWEDISDQISLPVGLRHGSILKISAAEAEALTAAVKSNQAR